MAAAHFVVSTYFEPNEYALSEIMYIKQAAGQDYTGMDIEKAVSVLEQADAPFTADPDILGGLAALIKIACEHDDTETALETAINMYVFTGDESFKELAETLAATLKEAAKSENDE